MSSFGPDINRKVQQRGRRGFLKLLTGLGVSGSAAAGLTKETLAEMDVSLEDEIPYVARKSHGSDHPLDAGFERTKEYETVRREKHATIEAACDAAKKLDEHITDRFSDSEELLTTCVTTLSDDDIGIAVKYTVLPADSTDNPRPAASPATQEGEPNRPEPSFTTVERSVPGRIDGEFPSQAKKTLNLGGDDRGKRSFPVVVEKETRDRLSGTCGSYYDDVYTDEVPAGCKFEEGTIGTPVYDTNDNWQSKLLTAGHSLDDSGEKVAQPRDRLFAGPNNIGTVGEYYNTSSRDFGLVGMMDDVSCKWRLADDNGGYKDESIDGIITWDRIKNTFQDEELAKQGAKTGISKGYVYEIRNDTRQRFRINASCGTGDSGCPVYERTDTGLYIGGILTDGGPKYENCPKSWFIGQGIEYIENELGVIV